jgi:hypothetical protein
MKKVYRFNVNSFGTSWAYKACKICFRMNWHATYAGAISRRLYLLITVPNEDIEIFEFMFNEWL